MMTPSDRMIGTVPTIDPAPSLCDRKAILPVLDASVMMLSLAAAKRWCTQEASIDGADEVPTDDWPGQARLSAA
jgi:hypothetical protein